MQGPFTGLQGVSTELYLSMKLQSGSSALRRAISSSNSPGRRRKTIHGWAEVSQPALRRWRCLKIRESRLEGLVHVEGGVIGGLTKLSGGVVRCKIL